MSTPTTPSSVGTIADASASSASVGASGAGALGASASGVGVIAPYSPTQWFVTYDDVEHLLPAGSPVKYNMARAAEAKYNYLSVHNIASSEAIEAEAERLRSYLGSRVDPADKTEQNKNCARKHMFEAEIIVVHGEQCMDGAYSLHLYLVARAEYMGADYTAPTVLYGDRTALPTFGKLMRLCRGKRVLMLDFVYDAARTEFLIQMASECMFFGVIDHHDGVSDIIRNMGKTLNTWAIFYETGTRVPKGQPMRRVCSAALLVWHAFFGGEVDGAVLNPILPPYLLDVVANDAFAFARYKDSSLVATAMRVRRAYAIDGMTQFMLSNVPRDVLISEGERIEEIYNATCDSIIATGAQIGKMEAGGTTYTVVFVDSSFEQSRMGARALEQFPQADFSLIMRSQHVIGSNTTIPLSIRTRPGGPDAAVIARAFGGNGSPNAAGAVTPYGINVNKTGDGLVLKVIPLPHAPV